MPPINSTGSLDPQAVNLAKAIRQTESGGNFQAVGKSGEYGAYQFEPDTWNQMSQKYLGQQVPLQQATPSQQNQVAYSQIKEWKDQGMNVGQIASMWNSRKPNAYLDPTYKGTNQQGVQYDVPRYAQSVATAYQSIKSGQQVGQDPNNPSSTANVPSQGKDFLGQLAQGVNSIFPGGKLGEALGTSVYALGQYLQGNPENAQGALGSQVSPSQVAGDIGQSILFPASLAVAPETALGRIGASIAFGAGLGLTKSLSQGETNPSQIAQATTEGAKTGGLFGAGGEAVASGLNLIGGNAPRVINSLIKPLAKDFSYGKDPGRAIADSGIVATGWDDLINKIGQERSSTGQEISQLSAQLDRQPLPNPISLTKSLEPIDAAMKDAAATNNPTLLQRLNNVKMALTNDLDLRYDANGTPQIYSKGPKNLEGAGFQDAFDFKKTIGDITAWTGNPSDDKTVNAALKSSYGITKQSMMEAAQSVDPKVAQKLSNLNEKYADLSSANIAARYRDKILERQNLVSTGGKLTGAATGAIGALVTGAAPVPTILAGLGGAAAEHAMSTPLGKTLLAQGLQKVGQGQIGTLGAKAGLLETLLNRR